MPFLCCCCSVRETRVVPFQQPPQPGRGSPESQPGTVAITQVAQTAIEEQGPSTEVVLPPHVPRDGAWIYSMRPPLPQTLTSLRRPPTPPKPPLASRGDPSGAPLVVPSQESEEGETKLSYWIKTTDFTLSRGVELAPHPPRRPLR